MAPAAAAAAAAARTKAAAILKIGEDGESKNIDRSYRSSVCSFLEDSSGRTRKRSFGSHTRAEKIPDCVGAVIK